MKIISTSSYEELSRLAAEQLAKQIRKKPNSVLGLATGSTPLGTYAELVRLHRTENLDFSGIATFNLDEYYGLSPEHPQSYRYFMNHELFNQVNIDIAATHVPNGNPVDLQAECRAYDALAMQMGGTDIQVLGLGLTGHIAFNEPGPVFHGETRLVDLDTKTIKSNARFFDSIEEVPKKAITVGMHFIMNSRLILMLINSSEKANVVERMVNGPIDPMVPASILQLHPNVMVIAQEGALSKL